MDRSKATHQFYITIKTQQMLSQIHTHSNTNINPEQQNHFQGYQQVRIEGIQYRVLSREYQEKSSMICFWCVFWICTTLLSTALLITTLETLNITVMLYSLLATAIILLALTIYLRKQLQKIIVFSAIDLALFVTALIVMETLSIKYYSIAAAIFILSQFLLSCALIRQKGKVFLELLVLAQLALIAAKLDGFINITWAQTLVPLVPFFAFLTAAFAFVLIYTLVLYCWYYLTFKSKRISLLFLLANLSCFTAVLAIPICWAFFKLNLTFFCILTMALTSTNSLYLLVYSQEVALNFCANKHEVAQNDKQRKIEVAPHVSLNKKPLYRYSSNWFGYQLKDSLFSQKKYPQCLVCMQRQSDIVWLPCGHMTLCQACCKEMIVNKLIHCMLCKQRPNRVCQVKQRDASQQRLQLQMGITSSKQPSQELVIAQYEIKIS